MKVRGNRTLSVCAVIVTLALCQKFLGVPVPAEIWIALFGLAIAFLRAGMGGTAIGCALPLGLAGLLLAGCVSVTNYVGDEAIRMAASGKPAELYGTNATCHAGASNTTTQASATTLKGSLIIHTSINKTVSPDTSTALQYIP